MADAGEKARKQAASWIEKKLRGIYSSATKTAGRRIGLYTAGFLVQDALKRKMLESGKLGKDEYSRWKMEKVFSGMRWKTIVFDVVDTMLKANRKANKTVREKQEEVFGEGANGQLYEMEMTVGLDTGLKVYDKDSVNRLLREHPELLPRRKVDADKDRGWNQTKIANAIAQSIINGESIPDTAARLAQTLGDSNMKTMTRYARTAMTSAENAGRMESMNRAAKAGIHIQKKWLATLDSRTRDSHQKLDGQIREINLPFKSPLGYIMYPGDVTAHPADVWNCRCTMVYVYPDFQDITTPGERRDGTTKGTVPIMSYEEWKKKKTQVPRPVDPEEIERINEEMAVQDLAEKYGVEGDVKDKTVVAKVADAVIRDSGLKLPESRWNGEVIVYDELDETQQEGFFDLDTGAVHLYKDSDFITSVHELIHSRSRSTDLKSYNLYREIEEASVETIAQNICAHYPVRQTKAYRKYTNALNHIASLTELTPLEIAVDLLDTPVEKRYDSLKRIVDAYADRPGIESWEVSTYRQMLYTLKGDHKE